MNKSIQTVLKYHETTKHSQHRYARSLGYLDWATQPNPFRNYKGAREIKLPLSFKNSTPPYHLLDENLPSAPVLKESISQFLQFSLGIAAIKISGDNSWAVRCNASSGNLHPTESYLILPPVLKEQNEKTSIMHYRVQNHSLEELSSFKTSFWDELPKNSFLLGLSSVAWREAWKYGERAFRYTQLDAGHAWQALVISAKMLGWKLTRLDSVSDQDIASLLGISQSQRFFEAEEADMLFVISKEVVDSSISIEKLIKDVPLKFDSIANRLSESMQKWEIIPEIQKAIQTNQIAQKNILKSKYKKEATRESKDIVLNRRSIHVMQKNKSTITKEQFHTMLQSISSSLDDKESSTHLCIFVHRIEEYESGLYILLRNKSAKEILKQKLDDDFKWQNTEFEELYLLKAQNYTHISKAISCTQDIASDGSFSLGMLCEFTNQLQKYGAHRYKELYWECGAVGQQLYLEATSLGLSGTGIGCYLDDMMHKQLGLKDNSFQILYHFTVGRGYVDSRISTKEAYS